MTDIKILRKFSDQITELTWANWILISSVEILG